MSYEPRPGTIPHRVIEKLAALDEGAELTNLKLAEMMGRAPSTLIHDLEAAIKRGAVIARPGEHGTKIIWLSLGTKPLTATPSHAEVVAMARNGNGALFGATPPTPPIAAAQATPVAERAARPPKPAAAATDGLRCALWSDGTLTIERGDAVLEFTAAEAKTLRLYLCDGMPA